MSIETVPWQKIRVVVRGTQILSLGPEGLLEIQHVIQRHKQGGRWAMALSQAKKAKTLPAEIPEERVPPGFLRCGFSWEGDDPATWGPHSAANIEWPAGFELTKKLEAIEKRPK